MDIERMKKINQMIPELKKQGFAQFSSDAAVQSDQMFRNLQGDDIISRTAEAQRPEASGFARLANCSGMK